MDPQIPQHWLKHWFCIVLASSVADPDPKSALFFTPGSGIYSFPDPGSWIPDHGSQSMDPGS
jgi:hypothetical protein